MASAFGDTILRISNEILPELILNVVPSAEAIANHTSVVQNPNIEGERKLKRPKGMPTLVPGEISEEFREPSTKRTMNPSSVDYGIIIGI